MKLEIVPWFEEFVDALWDNRSTLRNRENVFDYPDYGGLPPKIYSKLSPDTVDVIQDLQIDLFSFKTKREFTRYLTGSLFGEFVKVRK